MNATTAPRPASGGAPARRPAPAGAPPRPPRAAPRSRVLAPAPPRASRTEPLRAAPLRAAPRHATHRLGPPCEVPAGWRLTRRGRLLLTAGAVVASAGLGWAAAPQLLEPLPAAVAGSWGERVTVRPGDTLWELAARVAPDEDPRVVVEEIQERNGLDGAAVSAGDQLLLPAAVG